MAALHPSRNPYKHAAPGGGPGGRSPQRRRWSRWRRAGTDGHVLAAGRQWAGAGRRGSTRSARVYAAGADPRGQRGAHAASACQSRPADSGRPFPPPSFPPARTPAGQDLLPRTSGARSAACHLLPDSEARHSAPQSCARAPAAGAPARAGGWGRDPLAAAAAVERVEEGRRGRRCACRR